MAVGTLKVGVLYQDDWGRGRADDMVACGGCGHIGAGRGSRRGASSGRNTCRVLVGVDNGSRDNNAGNNNGDRGRELNAIKLFVMSSLFRHSKSLPYITVCFAYARYPS